jgi:hypothetical protein
MSTVKDNPNDPIIENALTTKKNNTATRDEKDTNGNLEKQENIAINKSGGDPDTGSGDPADFDAKRNNMHQKR